MSQIYLGDKIIASTLGSDIKYDENTSVNDKIDEHATLIDEQNKKLVADVLLDRWVGSESFTLDKSVLDYDYIEVYYGNSDSANNHYMCGSTRFYKSDIEEIINSNLVYMTLYGYTNLTSWTISANGKTFTKANGQYVGIRAIRGYKH